MESIRDLREVRLIFRALSDAGRLRLLALLGGRDEVSVIELRASARLSQPLMSWHLTILRRVGLVTTRRMGRQVFCRLNQWRLQACQQMVADLGAGQFRAVAEADPGGRIPRGA